MIIKIYLHPGYFCQRRHQNVLCGFEKDEKIRLDIESNAYAFLKFWYGPWGLFPGIGVVDPELEKLGRYRKSASGKIWQKCCQGFPPIHSPRWEMLPSSNFPCTSAHPYEETKQSWSTNQCRRTCEFPDHYLEWLDGLHYENCTTIFLGRDIASPKCTSMVPCFKGSGTATNRIVQVIPSSPNLGRSANVAFRYVSMGTKDEDLAKTPLMVLSYQVVIPHNGENSLNIKKQFGWIVNCFSTSSSFLSKWTGIASKFEPRHSFTTRLLFSLLPATWYAKGDGSIDGLAKAIADDLTKLFHDGVLVGQGEPQLNPLSVIAFGFWVL